MRTRYALLLALLSLVALPAAGQVQDNKGKEFYLAFLNNLNTPDVELHLTADAATAVTIHYPAIAPSFTTTVPVGPGAVTIVSLPVAAAQGWTANSVQDNAVHAFADKEFVAYMINRAGFSSDAALGLPIDVLNTRYRTIHYFTNAHGSDFSEFNVVAPYDNTTVTITPAVAMSGRAAGVPFDVVLDKGQGYHGRGLGSGAANDLTGTLIESDKPVFVVNGNNCTNVPPIFTACDHVFEVAQPVQSWGKEAMVSPLANRSGGSVYRVVASENNTQLKLDGANVAMLDAGQFHEPAPLPGAHVFSADKPVFIVQYMTGQNFSGAFSGDPAMGNMVPSEQFLQSYTFSTVGGNQFEQNYLNVIAERTDVDAGTILLDGVAIPAGDFTDIGATGYAYAVVRLTDGTHTTSSTGFHGITVSGYNDFDSYLYPGGAKFQFINPQGDANPPVCELALGANSGNGTATDNRPSEDVNNNGLLDAGEDLNGNGQIDTDTGIFLVQLAGGSTNLSLTVPPFVPGSGVVAFSVAPTDPNLSSSGAVIATDGAGNTCRALVEFQGGGGDDDAPVCRLLEKSPAGIAVGVQDVGSGLASIVVVTSNNADTVVPPFVVGETGQVVVNASKINLAQKSMVVISVTDVAGNSRRCDPVQTTLLADVPTDYVLEQNYPNPFNPSTAIRFALPEAAHARLRVYDVVGRLVATLLDAPTDAGAHEVVWDGRDAAGQMVPSGLYLYRLEAGAFTQTMRMTLAK